MNPVYKREMTVSSRTMRVALIVFIFNIIVSAVALVNMYMMVERVKITSEMQYSAFLELYILVASIEFALLALIIPALTAGSISGERERQTLDLMLTTKMKPKDIILGKLTSSFQTIFILIISSFPMLSLVFIYGGVQLYEIFVLLFLFYTVGVLVGSFSIWFSAVFKRTVISTVVSYLVLVMLIGGTIGINYLAHSIQTLRYMNYTMPVRFNVGGFIYLMLLNPAVTFYGLINGQAGDQNAIYKLCNFFGTYEENFMIDHWIPISIVIQLLLAGIFLSLAVRAIDPLKRKGK